jgi:hypothetical protein
MRNTPVFRLFISSQLAAFGLFLGSFAVFVPFEEALISAIALDFNVV